MKIERERERSILVVYLIDSCRSIFWSQQKASEKDNREDREQLADGSRQSRKRETDREFWEQNSDGAQISLWKTW